MMKRPFRVTLLACAAALAAFPAMAAKHDGAALISAVQDGLTAQATALIAAHADVNARDSAGATALSWAIMRSDTDMVARLLKAHANPDLADANGVTPAMLAIDNSQPDSLKLLLAAGANANTARGAGETLLMSAIRAGSADMVQMLLDKGAQVNVKETQFGQTALMWAGGHPDIVKLLLDKGADVTPVTKSWETASTNYTPSVTTLGITGIPWNNEGDYKGKAGGLNALMFAVQKGDTQSVKLLLDKGMDVNFTTADGTTPLLAALYKWKNGAVFEPWRVTQATQGEAGGVDFDADLAMANLLLDRGAKANASDRAGYTPLHGAVLPLIAASSRGQYQIGFNPNRNSKVMPPPKPPANEAAVLAIVKRLLDAGANPNAATIANTPGPLGAVKVNPAPAGSSPFHIAAASHSAALVTLMAEHGANPNLVRKDGHTPFSISVMMNDLPEVTAMVEHGADLNLTYNPADKLPDPVESKAEARKNQSILHIAAGSNANYVVEYLASKGAPLKTRNDHNETPLDLADAQERFRYNHDMEGIASKRVNNNGRADDVVRDTSTTDAFKKAMGMKVSIAAK